MPPKAADANDAMQAIIANMGTTIADAIAAALPAAAPTAAILSATKVDKLDKPALYDGKDKTKLTEFLGSLDMYFSHNGTSYATNPAAKVSFAGSRLDGKAKTWFMSHYQLDPADRPAYLTDYIPFCRELKDRFGLRDVQRHAETELEKLRMQDHHHFDQHIMLFKMWKNQIKGWNDRNYYNMLFDSLAPRIKAWLASRESPLPTTFDDLVTAVETHDDNYWAVDERVKTSKKPTSDKNDKSRQGSAEPKSDTNRDSSSPPASNKSKSGDNKERGQKRSHSGSPPNSRANSTPPSGSGSSEPPAYTKHLDGEGHITQAERDRRFKEGLCLYCGTKGHNAADCRKRQAKAASSSNSRPNTRARATVTLSSIEEVSGNEPTTQ